MQVGLTIGVLDKPEKLNAGLLGEFDLAYFLSSVSERMKPRICSCTCPGRNLIPLGRSIVIEYVLRRAGKHLSSKCAMTLRDAFCSGFSARLHALAPIFMQSKFLCKCVSVREFDA